MKVSNLPACSRIIENTDIITDLQTTGLLEEILRNDNLNKAYKKVKSNKGSGGVDGMDVEKFFDDVCQSKLIELTSRTIKDGKVISLIHKYMNAGVVTNGLFENSVKRTIFPVYDPNHERFCLVWLQMDYHYRFPIDRD